MLQVVSFDLDGTLIDSSYVEYVWKVAIPQLYAQKRGIHFEEAKNYVSREYNLIGSHDIRWYLPEYWFKRFNLAENPIEIFQAHLDKVEVYPEVSSVLERLSQKYELIIASSSLRYVIAIVVERCMPYFKQIFSSISDHRERKTLHFYERICQDLGIEPEALVHVGDAWGFDFIIPRKIGITSFYLDRTGGKRGKFVLGDLEELEDRLLTLDL